MRIATTLLFSAFAAAALAPLSAANAQINIQIGPAPACPYGYYDYAPYNCSPYGYYGPQWFRGGAFIGAGPWFHGPAGFHGYVNNRYDPHHGYHGSYPQHGEHAWSHGEDRSFHNFHGNESRGGYHGNDHGHGH